MDDLGETSGSGLFVCLDYSQIPERLSRLRGMLVELRRRLVEEEIASEGEIVSPRRAKVEDLALAHSLAYIDDVLNLRKTRRTVFAGLMLDSTALEISLLNVGATLQAADIALESGLSLQLTGGTVYASRDHALSLSFFNDVAIAMLKARARGRIRRGLVVSSDAYFPEGMVSILSDVPEVHTLCIFDEDNQTWNMPRGDHGVTVTAETGDEAYLEAVRSSVLQSYAILQPDLVAYLSSAKVQNERRDSGFSVSKDALMERDRVVVEGARQRGIPIMVLTAGGRTRAPDDYIEIHLNTARVVKETFLRTSS